jgi:hypothetical protein
MKQKIMNKLELITLAIAIGSSLTSISSSAATPLGSATWGNPDLPWGTRRSITEADRARIAQYRSVHRRPVYETNFNDAAAFAAQWSPQLDDRSELLACREAQSDVLENGMLFLKTLPAQKCYSRYSSGSVLSNFKQRYGFFEATMKIAAGGGINNAFWLTTDDHYEIDIVEAHYPNDGHFTVHDNNHYKEPLHSEGFDLKFADNFSQAYHDFGVLWTSTDIIFEVDGLPVAAIATHGAVAAGPATIRFSEALGDFGGKLPANPVGYDMSVKSLRVYPL